MKYFIIALFACSSFCKVFNQEKHFLFIQNNSAQPFYVQLNNNVYSSTASGYINIAQLLQGKYYLTIGFAKNAYPEQKFIVDITNGEAGVGFTLKQQDPKKWVLINYITQAVIEADTRNTKNENTIKQEPQIQIQASPHEKDITLSTPVVLKIYDKNSSLGVNQVYVDKTNTNAVDTISIFIPLNNSVVKASIANKPSPCNALAQENDFYKLRLDIAASNTENAMLAAAAKALEKKCYSVSQVKNLGVLILSEENRYRFFSIAKPHISDIENFASLSTQFHSSEYIQRFKMLAQ
jgi:hypothetical protein